MKNHISALLFCLITCLLFGQEQPSKFIILDNISLNNKIYSVKVKNDQFGFVLDICSTNTNCKKTLPFSKTVSASILSQGIINFIKTEFDASLTNSAITRDERTLLNNLVKKREKQEFQITEAAKTDLERTLGEIDRGKNQYSGKLIIHKEVPYFIKKKNETILTGTIRIIDSKVQFFNNKASSIYIKAERITYEDPKKEKVIKSKEKLIFLNNRSSVALRFFNNYGSKVSTQNKNKEDIWIDYNDVFDYESAQFFNYSVANDQVGLSTVSPDSLSHKVIQRRFFDFFTAIVYSDVLSFNGDNSNSLLNAQARLLIPLNLRNYGVFTPMRQFTTTANIALSSSFEDETRYIAITGDTETFNNFDLLKKNNLYAKIAVEVATIEYKRLFLNISLGYSAAFYRTGFRYTQSVVNAEDLVTNRQLLSLGFGPFLNFEIRPQLNFGADLSLSLEDINYNDMADINGRNFNNDVIKNSGHNSILINHNLINIEANFYWLTNPEKSKGGVFAKVGSYFHTDSNEIYPQIMVGYATNLTSFVNRFKPKKPDTN